MKQAQLTLQLTTLYTVYFTHKVCEDDQFTILLGNQNLHVSHGTRKTRQKAGSDCHNFSRNSTGYVDVRFFLIYNLPYLSSTR